MIEFHVDMSKELHQFINLENVKFDGTLSVRKREEVNLWCTLARTRQWSTRINLARSQQIDPKSDGEALLIIVYLNLEWMTMISTELSKPKASWHKLPGWESSKCCIEWHSCQAGSLTRQEPICKDIWSWCKVWGVLESHQQMSIPLEDIHDVLKAMHCFNHSSCHARALEKGLNINSMNEKYWFSDAGYIRRLEMEWCQWHHPPGVTPHEQAYLSSSFDC